MEFTTIKKEFDEKIKLATTSAELQLLKVDFLGKKGKVSALMQNLKNVENKKEYGQRVNELKIAVQEDITKLEQQLAELELDAKMMKSAIDVTLDGRQPSTGKRNVLIKVARDIEQIFMNLGYTIVTGPEVETEYHNFDALNLDKDHPARDMQDTFYVKDHLLLRTHTSNSQSRALSESPNQEVKIICPGKVYRKDDDDATHSHQFMQIEGLVVVRKENSEFGTLQQLKTTLTHFAREIFENDTIEIRMRNSFFPFTEPSVEVDLTCTNCSGKGCSICKQTGWIEVLGAGIIHQNVLSAAGYDAKEFTGFAFGIGVERIAMLKYGIEDIRNIYLNDNRFIEQF